MSDDEITFTVVPNEYGACPRCGAWWGNPAPGLDWPNRQKVDNHWRCYNPECTVGYYDPESDWIEERLSPEEAAASAARVKAEVDEMMRGHHFAEISPGHFQLVPDEDA